MKEARRKETTLRNKFIRGANILLGGEKPKISIDNITPQEIAEAIFLIRADFDKAFALLEPNSPIHKDFDIADVREALGFPDALNPDFHLDYPDANQTLRIKLLILCRENVLEIKPTGNNKPNQRGERLLYAISDFGKLKKIAGVYQN